MILGPEVESQLFQIHYQRNKNVWIFHVLLISISTYYQREKLFESNTASIALGLLGLALIMRFIFLRVFYGYWKRGVKWVKGLNYVGQAFIGVAWMVHFTAIYNIYGSTSHNANNTLLVIAGIITGASISNMAHPKSYHLLCGIMCSYLAGLYFLTAGTNQFVVLYIILFYLFNTYNLNLGFKQLVRSITNEIHAKAEKERVTRIIDTVPGYVAIFDKNLTCIAANKAVTNFYPTIVGKTIGNFDPESDWEKYLAEFLIGGKDAEVVESHSFKWGREVCMLRNTRRTFDGGLVFVSQDISELVEARNRLREQEAVSQYTAKLASLGEMAAGIAHEINNPLTIIQGSASVISKLVEQEPMDVPTIKLLTGKLTQTSERISKTIRSLKNLSRSGENDPFMDIDFAKMLDQCLELLRQRFDRDEVELRLPKFDRPVILRGREVQLSQVLMNLISNALDAIKNEEKPWIEISYKYGADSIDIDVTDSGPGVPPEIRNKIMEPFFTTKEVNQGTGLGLSISKNIMQSHKGELTLMDAPHTTFRMHLPLNLT